jgi:hypothetical protein
VNGPTERNDFRVSHLRKRTSDPPTYIIEVNGHDVSLSSEEFMSFAKLRARVEELHDMVVPRMKEDQWDAIRIKLHEAQEVIEAPEDASRGGEVMNHVMDFLTRFMISGDADDLLQGTPIPYKDEFIAFKSADLMNFLVLHRRFKIRPSELYAILNQHGATHEPHPIKIRGKSVRIWLFPKDKLNIQTEDYPPVKFETIGEEL